VVQVKQRMNSEKEKKFKTVWWYPGGSCMTEVGTKDHVEKFARDIQACGGTATIYRVS